MIRSRELVALHHQRSKGFCGDSKLGILDVCRIRWECHLDTAEGLPRVSRGYTCRHFFAGRSAASHHPRVAPVRVARLDRVARE